MKVKIKKLYPNATIPSKGHNSDFCYDCTAVSEEEIAPNVWKYGLGLSFEIDRESSPYNVSNISYSIDARPRSSIWKTGMILLWTRLLPQKKNVGWSWSVPSHGMGMPLSERSCLPIREILR